MDATRKAERNALIQIIIDRIDRLEREISDLSSDFPEDDLISGCGRAARCWTGVIIIRGVPVKLDGNGLPAPVVDLTVRENIQGRFIKVDCSGLDDPVWSWADTIGFDKDRYAYFRVADKIIPNEEEPGEEGPYYELRDNTQGDIQIVVG